MFLVRATRSQLIQHLPPGQRIAEIGVAQGNFSREILHACRPERLYLIDQWLESGVSGFAASSREEGEQRCRDVHARFAGDPAVEIRRAASPAAAADFADHSLDWIYVDADHHYQPVLDDLDGWDRTVKEDGLILGHDYSAHSNARKMRFGVVEAVHDFVAARGYELMFVTGESFATYVIAKRPDAPWVAEFRRQVLRREPVPLVHVEHPERRKFRQDLVMFPTGEVNVLFSWD